MLYKITTFDTNVNIPYILHVSTNYPIFVLKFDAYTLCVGRLLVIVVYLFMCEIN